MSRSVLDLSSNQAGKFFLKEESYFNSDLPPYFQFSDLLQKISKTLKGKRLSDFYNSNIKPKYCEDVNYRLITNKDGKYAWRPLQLIHPAFYVSLVHEITTEKNWTHIVNKLKFLMKKSKNIKCESMPLVTNQYKKDKAAQIIHWLGDVERQSICNSLEYDYLYHTDIVDCYGSIYTHSIAWALHDKPAAKEDRGKDKSLVGNIIDKKIEDMSYGQTNGIPQGSVLMDFISEIVLCHIDSLLSEKLANYTRKDYKIIRYRDDYRIFVNNPQVGEQIIKELSELIHDFGMRINSSKTKISDHITHNSLKEDKLYWMIHETNSDNLLNQLYKISFVAQRFPNSGKVSTLLKTFYDKIFPLSKNDIKNYNITVLISVLVDIAYKNPRTYPIISAILSKFIDFLPNSKKGNVIRKILNKFKKIPNTGIMQLWLQRITINSNVNDLVYSERLCQKVTDSSVSIWNSDWLQKSLKNKIDSCGLIDKNKLKELSVVIESEEIELFDKFESF
jgi:RNA-directed DNA polymerase